MADALKANRPVSHKRPGLGGSHNARPQMMQGNITTVVFMTSPPLVPHVLKRPSSALLIGITRVGSSNQA
ncbi:hypothetical protein D5086_015817 [Populus alba]|uniref:Uncharacterized protein n=1 Tax=Populus alba TaxID=43335 RepID=A0ACC4BSV2_POPAL